MNASVLEEMSTVPSRWNASMRCEMWWSVKEQGITIAFPQLDLHLDARMETAIRRLSPHSDELSA